MDQARIVDAALQVVDDVGIDALTMRRVASVLGVHVGGLYYHVADKAALLRAMADEMCGRILAALDGVSDRPQHWRDAVHELCTAVRVTLLNRRDASRLLAAAPLTGSLAAMELMDRLVALLDEGLDPRAAILAGDSADVLRHRLHPAGSAGHAADVPDLGRRPGDPLRVCSPSGTPDDDATFDAAVDAIVSGFGRPWSDRSPEITCRSRRAG